MSDQSSSRSTRRKTARNVATAIPASPAPSTDSWPTLLKRWQYEELTVEQAVGQLLLWGQYLYGESVRLHRLQVQLEGQVVALEEQDGQPPV